MFYVLGYLLIILLIDVEPESVHAQPQVSPFAVLDVKIVHAVHLQVLGDLQILHHGILPAQHGSMENTCESHEWINEMVKGSIIQMRCDIMVRLASAYFSMFLCSSCQVWIRFSHSSLDSLCWSSTLTREEQHQV